MEMATYSINGDALTFTLQMHSAEVIVNLMWMTSLSHVDDITT